MPGQGAALPEREQWAEREREMEHRERTRAEREWDRDKVRDFGPGKPGEEAVSRRSCSRERKRKERKMDKKGDELVMERWGFRSVPCCVSCMFTLCVCFFRESCRRTSCQTAG